MKLLLAFILTFSFLYSNDNDSYVDYEKWHEYSSYITLGLIGATILSTENRGIHATFGTLAGVSMVGTSALGIYAHSEDVFDLSEGWQKIHWHSLISSIATIALVSTLIEAPEEQHQILGMIGGISAVISFTIVKW